MPIDPRQLRPTELVRLLNSTPLGEVISERQLLRHRSRAGFRIGDARHVDLFRYVAWLVAVRHEPRPEPEADPYGLLKERARARNAALSLAGRDIGEIPAVVNPERRAKAEQDFRFFCETYFPAAFTLSWSPDHLKVIAKIERAVLTGGLFAHAMPRGSGKTTLTSVACVWAILYGACPFVCLIAAAAERARSLLANIKTWFETQRAPAGGFSRGGLSHPQARADHEPATGPDLPGRADPHRVERRQDRPADHPRQQGQRRRHVHLGHEGQRDPRPEPRPGRRHDPPSPPGDDRRPADDRVGLVAHPEHSSARRSWPATSWAWPGPARRSPPSCCCTVIRPGDMADNILDRDKAPAVAGRADQDGLRVSHQREASGPATPRSAPRASATTAMATRRPSSIGRTARRWTPAPSSPGPSGTTRTNSRPSSTP